MWNHLRRRSARHVTAVTRPAVPARGGARSGPGYGTAGGSRDPGERAISTHSAAGEHRLTLTGERTLPGIEVENYWFRRHEAAYQALLPRCRGQLVLEAGCGEGYGAAALATVARRVVAVDYDGQTTTHVATTYPQLHTVRGNLAALPFHTGQFDVVASLQVLEHLWDQAGFLRECGRVLRPDGSLLLSTPNRLTFSPDPNAPRNPFHSRELDAVELDELLTGAGFRLTGGAGAGLTGVHHGPRLAAMDARHGGSLVAAQLARPWQEWSAGLRADVAAVRAGDFVLTGTELDGSLDLVAVARWPDDRSRSPAAG
ncbi:MAG: class I SAM-dependent methyltransferase [Actinobacteria bacterium]|nr:class I SAM-dependent methyltransferase [Actinomycetota bacterium]